MNCNVIYNLTLKKINVVRLRWQYSFITYKNGHILVIKIYSISLSLHFFLIYVIKSLNGALPHARDWNHLINASPKKNTVFNTDIYLFSIIFQTVISRVHTLVLSSYALKQNKCTAIDLFEYNRHLFTFNITYTHSVYLFI